MSRPTDRERPAVRRCDAESALAVMYHLVRTTDVTFPGARTVRCTHVGSPGRFSVRRRESWNRSI